MTATIGVITFPGTLDDVDAARAARTAGAEVKSLWHADTDLHGVDAVVVPGGFSYGDYLRSGAISALAPVMQSVIDRAKQGMPVLGICRGMQSLNIALGGDLVQHLEETSVAHRDATHEVTVCASGTLVEQVMGASSWQGRSIHHQVVGRVADGLIASARTADGQIEAIESVDRREHPWLGVQWHPELQWRSDPAQLAPFRWLATAASAR